MENISDDNIKAFIAKNPEALTEFALSIMLGLVVGHMQETMKEEQIRAAFETAIRS